MRTFKTAVSVTVVIRVEEFESDRYFDCRGSSEINYGVILDKIVVLDRRFACETNSPRCKQKTACIRIVVSIDRAPLLSETPFDFTLIIGKRKIVGSVSGYKRRTG